MEERYLQREIIKNFVAIKKRVSKDDFTYRGNLSKDSFINARYSEAPNQIGHQRPKLDDSINREESEDLSSDSDHNQ